MALLASSFIESYNLTDVVLSFQDTLSQRIGSINIRYTQKVVSEEKQVWIFLEDTTKIILIFSSNNEATTAAFNLNTALNILWPNIKIKWGVNSIISVPGVMTSLTLNQYITLVGSSSVIPFQTYKITDEFDVFGFGTFSVITVNPFEINDSTPYGKVDGTNFQVRIDVLNSEVVWQIDSDQRIHTSNNSSITRDLLSNNITVLNESTLTVIDSKNIFSNKSVLDLNQCYDIEATRSNLILFEANNATFTDISQDLSSYGALIENINVNKVDTQGKYGAEVLSLTDNETLYAYINKQNLVTPVLVANITKILENPITEANAIFTIAVAETFNDFTLTIKDSSLTILKVITSAYSGSLVTFTWNKNTNKFIALAYAATPLHRQNCETVTSNGQTSFPNMLDYKPLNPTETQMFVGSLRVCYGYDYLISGRTVTWQNNSWELEIGEVLTINY